MRQYDPRRTAAAARDASVRLDRRCRGWSVVAVAVALASVPATDADARVLVGAASVLGPLAAVAAALALRRRLDRTAGALLLVSVLTPTYFAWVLNIPALIVGLVLLVEPPLLVGRDSDGSATPRGTRAAPAP